MKTALERIYFDNNATTKMDDEVILAMNEIYKEPYNSSSIHSFGRAANKFLNEARSNIKKLLNAISYDVILTSGGTESNNLAFFGLKNYQIITSEIEHPAAYNAAQQKNAQFVRVDENGIVDINHFKEILSKIDGKNFMVSVMLANNETGAIQPLAEIAKLTHQKGGLVHSDAVQAVGKIAIDLEDLNLDMISLSSHKLNGPQGVGALLIRKGVDISPILYGSAQEGGRRPGTVNIAGAAGLGIACRTAIDKIARYKKLGELRDILEKELIKIAGDEITIFSREIARLPNTSFIATHGIDNQTQLIDLDLSGIAVSIGAACSSGSSKPSRVLHAMGVADDIAKCAIRMSFGLDNQPSQMGKFIEVWERLYKKLRINNEELRKLGIGN